MLTNLEIVKDVFTCKSKRLADYLIYTGKLPLFGIDNGNYYFAKTKEFYNIYNNLPIWYRLFK